MKLAEYKSANLVAWIPKWVCREPTENGKKSKRYRMLYDNWELHSFNMWEKYDSFENL